MPSTLVALRITSALISMARSEAAVSVEKYGLPVPPAKMTMRSFSRCRIARRRMNGSATWFISMADCTRVCTPCFSSASCKASALITVESMNLGEFLRNIADAVGIDAKSLARGQRLAGKFQQDAFEYGLGHEIVGIYRLRFEQPVRAALRTMKSHELPGPATSRPEVSPKP